MKRSRPRVLCVIDSLAPGGAERSLVEVAPHLLQRGIDLQVVALYQREGFSLELAGSGVPLYHMPGASRARLLLQLHRTVTDLRPDLVHTTLYEADQLGRIAALTTRTPVVSSLVNVAPGAKHLRDSAISAVKWRAAHGVDLATARVVDEFHAVSAAVAEDMSPRLGIPMVKIVVIPRGRDQTRLGRRTFTRHIAARRALGSGADPLLVAIARNELPKRLDVLINAMPLMLKAHPGVHLMIAGHPGPQTALLRAVIARHQLTDHVTLLGHVADIPTLLCAADIFVLPTEREGMSGATIEALALETPVVASDIPGVRAVVDHSTAMLVPSLDPHAFAAAILAAIEHPTEARTRALAGRVRFEQLFTIEGTADQWTDFYRRVAETSRRLARPS